LPALVEIGKTEFLEYMSGVDTETQKTGVEQTLANYEIT